MSSPSRYFATALGALTLCCAIWSGEALAGPIAGQGTWENTLAPRVLKSGQANGPDAYFDSALNITWLADTRLSAALTFGISGIPADGRMNWATAQDWLSALNGSHYLGHSDWRLPKTFDFGTPTYTPSPSSSEMAHLYYIALGNPDYFNGPIQNTGPFADLPGIYWSSAVDNPYISSAAYFNMNWGNQQTEQQSASLNVLVVRSGDTAPIPEPASYLLVLAGLFPLAVLARRRCD